MSLYKDFTLEAFENKEHSLLQCVTIEECHNSKKHYSMMPVDRDVTIRMYL